MTNELNGINHEINGNKPFTLFLINSILVRAIFSRKLIHAEFGGGGAVSTCAKRDTCHAITNAFYACHFGLVIGHTNAVRCFAGSGSATTYNLCLSHLCLARFSPRHSVLDVKVQIRDSKDDRTKQREFENCSHLLFSVGATKCRDRCDTCINSRLPDCEPIDIALVCAVKLVQCVPEEQRLIPWHIGQKLGSREV